MALHHIFDGMTWPLPGEDMDELEWRMRYSGYYSDGHLDKNDRYSAASIIGAYSELVRCSAEKRRHVVAELRTAQKGQSK